MEEKTTPKQTRVEHIATQMTKTLRDREKTTMPQMTMTEVIDFMGDLKKGLTVIKKVHKTSKNFNNSVHEFGYIEIKEFDNVAKIPNDTQEPYKFGPDFTGMVKHNESPEEVLKREAASQTTQTNQTNQASGQTKSPGETTGVEYAKDAKGKEIIITLAQQDIDENPDLAAAGLAAGMRLRLNKEAVDKAKKIFFQGAEVVREEIKPAAPAGPAATSDTNTTQAVTTETTEPVTTPGSNSEEVKTNTTSEAIAGGDGAEKTAGTVAATSEAIPVEKTPAAATPPPADTTGNSTEAVTGTDTKKN